MGVPLLFHLFGFNTALNMPWTNYSFDLMKGGKSLKFLYSSTENHECERKVTGAINETNFITTPLILFEILQSRPTER